ncbi:MAG: hypothetical protein ACLTSX_02980 [Collinsella sp.]
MNPHSRLPRSVISTPSTASTTALPTRARTVATSGRDKDATVENGKLNLAGGALSHCVESPLDQIGDRRSSLSLRDIEADQRPACPGDILFEADAPYGTLDIRVMDNGKLGFTRELYNYYFDYKLPVGKKVHVEIVTATQKTILKVDGETIRRGPRQLPQARFAKRVTKDGIGNSTFTLPLQRVGSKTHASIAAEIDNIGGRALASTDKTPSIGTSIGEVAGPHQLPWTQTGESARWPPEPCA